MGQFDGLTGFLGGMVGGIGAAQANQRRYQQQQGDVHRRLQELLGYPRAGGLSSIGRPRQLACPGCGARQSVFRDHKVVCAYCGGDR